MATDPQSLTVTGVPIIIKEDESFAEVSKKLAS